MPLLQSQVPGASRFSCSQIDAWATWWYCNPQSTECTQVCVPTGAESICKPSPAPLPRRKRRSWGYCWKDTGSPRPNTASEVNPWRSWEFLTNTTKLFFIFWSTLQKIEKKHGVGFFFDKPNNLRLAKKKTPPPWGVWRETPVLNAFYLLPHTRATAITHLLLS